MGFFFRIDHTVPVPSELDSYSLSYIVFVRPSLVSINVELLFSSLTSIVPETTNVSEDSV